VTNLLGPNLVGDQQAKSWSIGICWRTLGTWLSHEELRDLHYFYLIKPSHLDHHVFIIYPLCLLAVTCSQVLYIESYSPLCMCWFLYHSMRLYMLWYLLVLFWVIMYVHVGLHIMYLCLCLSLCYILLYLTWLLWEFNGLLMACKYSSLGTPRGRYDEHSSKSSLSCETKVYTTSRRKPNFRRWCLLASWHSKQWRQKYCRCVFT
jgi:hypothetical protein